MAVRVMLVDDHELVLEGLRALLSASPHLEIVFETTEGREAIKRAGMLLPDVAIVDVTMPDTNGVEVVRGIRDRSSRTKIIALSMHNSAAVAFDMMREGASAYVTKNSSIKELVRVIDSVMAGRRYISKELAGPVYKRLGQHDARGSDPGPVLTARERAVLKYVASGKNSDEIAQSLSVKTKTVVWHRQNIMRKLKIRGIAELTKYATRMGLIPL